MTVAADYSTSIEAIRAKLAAGTRLTAAEAKSILTLLKHAADALSAIHVTVPALRAVWDAQIAILQAGGTGNIAAAVDTADAAVEAALADVEADDFGTVAYVSSTVADG